jgi:uracil-DNA glycosylase family 4
MFFNTQRPIVHGKGPKETCQIAFVGEAPGVQEEKAGAPFVGISGSLLVTLMQSAGISRSEVYMTNVVKERPSKNDISEFFEVKRNGANTTPAFDEYVRGLKAELQTCSANVIVAVGGTALYALTGKFSATKWRGSILESTLLPGRKVICIIHPASALRQYIFRHFISFDLRRIKAEAEFRDIRIPSRSLIIEPSFDDCIQFLNNILEHEYETACDIEVTNEEVSCISFSPTPFTGISIPFYDTGKDYFTLDQEVAIWKMIERIFLAPRIKKIFQNGIFDMTFLFNRYGLFCQNYDDTMIGQAVMYPDFPKGLDFITSIFTTEPYYKDEGKKHFKYGGVMRDFWLYNAKDSAVCSEAMPKIKADLERLGNLEVYETQTQLIEPLMYMSARGMKVNVEARDKEAKESEERIKELEQQLWSITSIKLNHASPKQLCEYFYNTKGHKPYLNRKTGGATVDGDALKRLSRKGFEEARIIQDIRGLAKRKSTYLEMQLDMDGRIRSSFNPVGTDSLRLSSSKTIFDTGGNTQNLPYDVRKFIEADIGYVCYQMDLSQAENRMVAYLGPEPAMIQAFESGADIHRQTAALIFGKPMEEISDEDGSCPIGGGMHSERFWGKKANHGLNYDLGYKTFAFYYEIPESDSKFICERYHTAYPGVRRYHQWVRDKLAKDRILTNLFGWNRLFLDQWGDQLFKVAYSFIPQSSIAALLNRKGIVDPYYSGIKIEYLNNVHDSIWFQKKLSDGWLEHARCLMALKQSMEAQLRWGSYSFNIPVDTEIGLNFGKNGADNPGGLVKVKFTLGTSIEDLAAQLERAYTNTLCTKNAQSGEFETSTESRSCCDRRA